MKLTVEGLITSIEQKSKEEKKFTELLLAQPGEKVQVNVRLQGHVANDYQPLSVAEFTGRLMTWNQRDGVGMMVMADSE